MALTQRKITAVLAMLACATLLAACEPKEAPDSAVLVVESTPEPGAEVIIGGESYGTTPATIRGLEPGQYFAILKLYGYKPRSESFVLPETGEVRLNIELRPIVGYLSLESEPAGAKAFLDNSDFLGTTPLVDRPVPIGAVNYELRLENYVTARGTLEVEEDYTYKRRHVLEQEHGSLFITSVPTGSKIFINDVMQEKTTPAGFELAPGVYSVGAYHDGYLLGETSATIQPNAKESINLTLKEGYMPMGMVLIPAGEFIMGADSRAPDERPRRTVHVDAFYIDKFEVTNKEFAEIFPDFTYDPRKKDHPVSGVTWSRATAYAAAVGKRLPTEAEWEKAARGEDGREYPWGNSFDPKLCNSRIRPGNDSPIATTKVGSYRAGASPYGVLDMAGNVYEWTSTWYQPYPGNLDVKDAYGQVYRVLRGGSYLTDDFRVRVMTRHYDKIDNAKEDYGFRCALDANAPPPTTSRSRSRLP